MEVYPYFLFKIIVVYKSSVQQCRTRRADLNSTWMALVETSQFLTVWSIFRFYPSKMYKWGCKQVSLTIIVAETSIITERSPVLFYVRNVYCLYVTHAMTCHTPCNKTLRKARENGTLIGAIFWPVRYWCSPLPTEPSSHLKAGHFCEFVIFVSRRFATRLRRSFLSPPKRKNLWHPG